MGRCLYSGYGNPSRYILVLDIFLVISSLFDLVYSLVELVCNSSSVCCVVHLGLVPVVFELGSCLCGHLFVR